MSKRSAKRDSSKRKRATEGPLAGTPTAESAGESEQQASDAVSASDWSAVPELDPALLETGLYKFSGPAENRAQDRISQRELGLVDIAMRLPGATEWAKVRLWDFTSISFGVVLEDSGQRSWPAPAGIDGANGSPGQADGDARAKAPIAGLAAGDEVEIRLKIQGRQEFTVWCAVKNTMPRKDGFKIGLRRLDVGFPRSVDANRRAADRLPIAPTLALKARLGHPFIYGHWCGIQVSDLNRDMGLSFTSSDPSILLFEGMEIKVHFELATFRGMPMAARVTWVHATESNQVRFGVACLDMAWKLHNAICDFLIFSRQWSPGRLRQAGFRAQRVKGRLRFRSVKTMDDYAEVLHLRREAYVGAGKRGTATRAEDMAGKLDGQSRILMAHHQEKLVGTLTFTFPHSEDTLLDSQSGFPGGRYPVRIPPKINLIEVSRLCIQDDYRSTDLLQGLFEHGVKHFLMSDRHWLLTSAVAELLPIYRRIGFKTVGAAYKHPGLNYLEHHLILAHRDTFLCGKGMNLLVWNALFGDLIRHLLSRGLIKVPLPVMAAIRCKLLLAPLSRRLTETGAARAFRKHLELLRRERVREALAFPPAKSAPDPVPTAAANGAPDDPDHPAREAA